MFNSQIGEITIDTSIAKIVAINLYSYNDILLSSAYTDKTDPDNILDINLTDYAFEFVLTESDRNVRTYSIDAGQLTSTFLSKEGDHLNVLQMRLMWEDIRNWGIANNKSKLKLLQNVTDPDNVSFIYIVYHVNVRKY